MRRNRVHGRRVFPALGSLVAAAAKPFPTAVICPAQGTGCGPLGVAHDGDQAALLGMRREAHRLCCNSIRSRKENHAGG